MDIETLILLISWLVAIAATLILTAYFFREYFAKRLRASLAWAIGFLVFLFASFSNFSVDIRGEVTTGKPVVAVGLVMITLALVSFYYGASLLFFSRGSFFREKASILILAGYLIVFSYLIVTQPVEGFKEAVGRFAQIAFMMPIFFIMSFLFYRVSARLASGDPRKTTLFLVSAGWFLNGCLSPLRVFVASAGIPYAMTTVVYAVAWVLILYGMVLGKAART